MTIKKRLAVSNILMLLIPVAVTLLTGVVFLAVVASMMSGEVYLVREEHFYEQRHKIADDADLRPRQDTRTAARGGRL